METYDLADLTISQGSQIRALSFTRAKLMVVSEYGSRLWYIDIEGVTDDRLLDQFAAAEDIAVDVTTTSIGGRKLQGRGFFHPNPQHNAAAIRGDGQLEGYDQPNGKAL